MPGSRGNHAQRQKDAQAVVWCDGLGWIGVPNPRQSRNHEADEAERRERRATLRRPLVRAPPSRPVHSAWPARRSAMVTAKVSLRTVREMPSRDPPCEAHEEEGNEEEADADQDEWEGLREGDLAALGSMGGINGASTLGEEATDNEWDVVSEAGSVTSDGSYCLV